MTNQQCLPISKDLNMLETLLFTECQNSIELRKVNVISVFGNLVGSLTKLLTKIKS